MEELSTEEMVEVSGGRALALPSGPKNISVGNVAVALNVDVNVLSGNGGGGGLNTGLTAIAQAGTISSYAHSI